MSSVPGIRSGWSQRVSRTCGPTASVTVRQKAAASRRRRGRISRPTSVPKAFSAGPPVARLRRADSAIASRFGRRAVAASVTASTQPSMRAIVVSRRASASSCSGVLGGMSAPLESAWRSSSGFDGSKDSASSSSRSTSMWMPSAYSRTDDSTCRRSQRAWWKRRACASSRAAIQMRT